MRRLAIAVGVATVVVLAPMQEAQAFEFLCRSWRITGFFNNGCPAGIQHSDNCGCAPHQPHTAPKWFGAQLAMVVENQGGNGITAAQFVQASQEAAQAWTNVSSSNFVLTANQTIPANNNAPWGSNSSERGVYYITTQSEWINITGSGAGGTLGIAVSPWTFSSCTNRSFTDSDIIINGFIGGGWTFNSVKSTILHEMGHSVGLGHGCLYGVPSSCSNSCQAVMGATAGDYVVPQQDDANGLAALYPGTPGGLGSACSHSDQCTAGPCITYESFSYCSQSCGTCPDGYDCRSVSPHGNVCTRRGAPGVGDSCTSTCASGAICLNDGFCHALCNSDAQCAADERCAPLQGGGGVCIDAGTQQEGEQCGGGFGECAPGNICISSGRGSPAYCYRECDGTNPASCGSGKVCNTYGGGLSICEVAAGEGQDCVATGYVCEPGLQCSPNDSGSGYSCRWSCNFNDPESCGPAYECVTLSQNNTPVGGACYPSGNAQEGDVCLSAADCAGSLICVNSGGSARCYHSCVPGAAACPWNGQSCTSLQGGGGFCTPPGGTGCGCDVSDGCDLNCSCDADCGPITCACNMTAACDADCSCDPDCGSGGGNGGAGSGGGAVCECDKSTACDADCPCDPECWCECDTSTACDADCPCDPECAGGCDGCTGGGSDWALIMLVGVGLLRRRRRGDLMQRQV